jgi:radical SAM domain protein
MYRDVPFAVETMEQIERDLLEARRYYGAVERIFLLNGDAFVLGFDRLRAIAEKIIEIFPEVESIGCYASMMGYALYADQMKSLAKMQEFLSKKA